MNPKMSARPNATSSDPTKYAQNAVLPLTWVAQKENQPWSQAGCPLPVICPEKAAANPGTNLRAPSISQTTPNRMRKSVFVTCAFLGHQPSSWTVVTVLLSMRDTEGAHPRRTV